MKHLVYKIRTRLIFSPSSQILLGDTNKVNTYQYHRRGHEYAANNEHEY